MTRTWDPSRSTVMGCVAIPADGALDRAIEARADIFAMTQAAEEAVLRPVEAGAWGHALRYALAARIAAQNGLPDLAGRYAAGVDDPTLEPLCDPAHAPAGDLARIVHFMDDVAVMPRYVTAEDVAGLQEAGVADADIVRLAELNAFMAYHCRLIAGLKLLRGDAG